MIMNALERFNLSHVKVAPTPMDSNTKYDSEDSAIITDPRIMREALGALLWIANSTRLDISFAVHFASRHREKPRQCHWELVKRIF
ncbi:TPA: hypothetical protein N0F65_002905 [Lagenidium giganteum]|uniref:Uncharacterized protein n=1 Tax=Lagenidium giganteum TaxID=4803 RepID=A0AAV2Z8D3_9STRA|nr:TPA: hypothetical protein N0F65_002905 [Lagenidium giganteum]